MFKKTIPDKQADLFSSVATNLAGKAKKLYDDQKAWHNLFRKQILQRIDETPYQRTNKRLNGQWPEYSHGQ